MEEVLFREKKYPIRKGGKQDGKGNELSKNVISRDHTVCCMLGSEGGQRGQGRPVAFCNPCQSLAASSREQGVLQSPLRVSSLLTRASL